MFYLRLNDTGTTSCYWSRPAQNWTRDHKQATLFETQEQAATEANYAQRHTKGEIEICPVHSTYSREG